MDWLRYYTATLDNPKIQNLPDNLFKFWINLLCLARVYDGNLPAQDIIQFRLRSDEKTTTYCLHELEIRGLIDRTKGRTLRPHDWDEHQYSSDNSTDRVRKHRMKQSGNVSRNVSRNVSVTPPEQSRAETEQSRGGNVSPKPVDDAVARMISLHPKSANETLVAHAVIAAIGRGAKIENIEACHAAMCALDNWTEKNAKFCPKLEIWIGDNGFTKWPKNGAGTAEAPEYYDMKKEKAMEDERRAKLQYVPKRSAN